MSADHLKRELLSAIARDPDAAFNLLLAASEVVADYHEWGPVLQADENGEYTDETAIIQLERARDAFKRLAGWSTD